MDELKNAITKYDQEIKADPKNAEAYIGRMLAYVTIGNIEKAMADFDNIADLSENNHQFYYDAQKALQKTGVFAENTTIEQAWWKIAPRPAPFGWNKTTKDLKEEIDRGEREDVTFAEVQWASEYERSLTSTDIPSPSKGDIYEALEDICTLISSDMRFPSNGDIYEALEDICVEYYIAWKAPVTGSDKGEIKKGDRVVIDQEPSNSESIGVYAVAVDYEALEKRIVPASIRNAPLYNGFYFYLRTFDLNRRFKLIHEDKD
jgi:tetratricopeptide (TPR) repeat protein